jgi:signal recognition particle receptor subunit alpha
MPCFQNGLQSVELYEKGYGKDAAGIAMEAINYARTSKIDVVLVDTAGRMQVMVLTVKKIFQ